MSSKKKQKIIAIVGTTASGKTTWAVKLAYDFNGEIISADSRQVYKYMDIGTGKDLAEYALKIGTKKINIPYHLIDVAHPRDEYSLGNWLKEAKTAIEDIKSRSKLPIIAGGTGLYAQALIDGYRLSDSSIDRDLRAKLEKLKAGELFKKLSKINKKFAAGLHVSDQQNKRRLIRYIEIALNGKRGLNGVSKQKEYNSLIIGLSWPREVLKARIFKRLQERLEKEDMVAEVASLHSEHGLSWEKIKRFGLEYKFVAMYLEKEISYEEMFDKLNRAIYRFSKRQMTWLKRWEKQGTKIFWLNDYKDAKKIVKDFT